MRTTVASLSALVTACVLNGACGSVPVDARQTDKPPSGVIRGTVVYRGLPPCSKEGRLVGAAVLLFFDRDDPPPPAGFAFAPKNFAVVPASELFRGAPAEGGPQLRCPEDEGRTAEITAAAPFTVSPFDAGRYVAQAFFDRRGEFFPTFSSANMPRAGDVGGGHVDVDDAAAHAGDPNYTPRFLPIEVGTPSKADAGEEAPLEMPSTGFVAEGVIVTLGARFALERPVFHMAGADVPPAERLETPANAGAAYDPMFAPTVRFTQDHRLLAPPSTPTPATALAYERSFPTLRLEAGLPLAERSRAADPRQPFRFPASVDPPEGTASLLVWRDGERRIPEGQVPSLWPLVALTKLVDDPTHALDPQGKTPQGSVASLAVRELAPVVVLQGITLARDALLDTILGESPASPFVDGARVDHLTALVRTAALCIDPRRPADGGVLVTPHLRGPSADPADGERDLFDVELVRRNLGKRVRKVQQGCLPTGRYAVNLVYPSGQAWTIPNETGSCAPTEGRLDMTLSPPSCVGPGARPTLPSQGTRAVVEILPAEDPAHCQNLAANDPTLGPDGVPLACTTLGEAAP